MYAKPALVRPHLASDFDLPVALWTARLAARNPVVTTRFNESLYSDEMRQMIGIAPLEFRLKCSELRPLLKTRAIELERIVPRRKTVLARNIELLANLLGLDALQAEILAFAALSEQHLSLADTVRYISATSIDEVVRALSIALNVREPAVRKAISPEGLLLKTRVVRIIVNDVHCGLSVHMPDGLRYAMFGVAGNLDRLMRSFIEPAPRPKLRAAAFTHLNEETALLSAYLAKASETAAQGVNILIYGAVGTGKTEYVRWLAAQLNVPLYQVKGMDLEGDAISGYDRLAFFQLSQRFLHTRKALILFDEIEDVFQTADGDSRLIYPRKLTAGKLFINSVLESNPLPAIWVANDVDQIDKAHLRRFDFSFEMGVPPITVRRGILHGYLQKHAIAAESLNYLSQQEQLSPAQIEKAAKVLTVASPKAGDRESTLMLVIENGMALLGQPQNDAFLGLDECHYALDYLNPDCDVQTLVAQLKRAPNSVGALCFYGAPGTGKTALAHYIARETELPLLIRRASDIISPYVGETEQKIALMFKQARQDGALLLLDEADSFLSERQSARNSWEVTAVNEMLTQMERFDGLFICSTNLMQRLDAASLRRFALKIKFDYLKPEQRWRLFLAQAKQIHRRQEGEYRAALSQLNNLTPGDFATVRRQAALLNIPLTADELIKRLQHECKSKAGGEHRPIGFIQTPAIR